MNNLRNNKGITVAELLAALAISSILIILIVSMIITFQNQYEQQSDQAKALTDISIAAQAITKDIRASDNVEIPDDRQINIFRVNKDPITYNFNGKYLLKNNNIYLYRLKNFYVKRDGSKITLRLTNESNKQVETTIVLREVHPTK